MNSVVLQSARFKHIQDTLNCISNRQSSAFRLCLNDVGSVVGSIMAPWWLNLRACSKCCQLCDPIRSGSAFKTIKSNETKFETWAGTQRTDSANGETQVHDSAERY